MNTSIAKNNSDRATILAASVFGLGFLPKAPGTWGTLAALPLWYVMRHSSFLWFLLGVFVVALIAIAVARAAEKITDGHDAQWIVIDEVAGMLVAAIGVPFSLWQVVFAFVLFRLFDALKPPPIRQLDDHVPGGLGVVVDDLAAGVFACGVQHMFFKFYGSWLG